MYRPVSDCIDILDRIDNAYLRVRDFLDDDIQGILMILQRFRDRDLIAVCRLIGYVRTVNSDTFRKTFCENLFGVHIQKLVFKRRAAGVNNEYFHLISFESARVVMIFLLFFYIIAVKQ